MKLRSPLNLLGLIVLTLTSMVAAAEPAMTNSDAMTPAGITARMKRTADWQLAHPRHHALDWTNGALWAGMTAWAKMYPDDRYFESMRDIFDKHNWTLRPRRYHADDHCVGQTYIELYEKYQDPLMIRFLQDRFDWILAHPATNSLKVGTRGAQNRWNWCDALFMAPTTWTKLAEVTGEKKYLDFMLQEYKVTTDYLYDKEEHLYYRDSKYFSHRSKNGHKVFWSRGNGWVFGGLPIILESLPKSYPERAYFETIFKEMAAKLITIQGEDGCWRPSLLDHEDEPTPETSGTGFFTFGLAWGINNGLLDKNVYEPSVVKGWKALVAALHPNGKLGWVQPIGENPKPANKNQSQVYGVGAFLLAGSEVYKMVGGHALKKQQVTGLCAGRYVPERLDDFAWENDRVAFRMYGPALWKKEADKCGSGIDVWVKKVRYPIINKWYKDGNYHKDNGEGADFYKVGTSRGCGGTGILVNGKLHNSANWAKQKVIKSGGDYVEFELTFAPWKAGNATVSEVKRISMKKGTNLFKVKSTFTVKGADSVDVATGIALRGSKGQLRNGKNWMSYAEPKHRTNGQTFCAVILPKATAFKKVGGHGLLVVPVKDGETVTYYAGAGWSKGLDFKTAADWLAYVKSQAAALKE